MADAVMYDDSSHGSVTLGGTSATAPVALHNVAAGELSATSNDAVNGSQLYATNQQVEQNTGDITNLQNNFDNGTIGLVQQDPSTGNITVAAGKNGSVVDFTGTEGARQLTGVAPGELSATSTDAVNGSQLFATNQQVAQNTGDITNLGDRVTTNEGDITTLQGQMADAVLYDDSSHGSVTLGGTSATAPVALHNVAAGELSATSTDAVNGSQLYATNQQVSQNTTDISNLQSGIVADTRYFKADGKNDGTDDAQVTTGSNSVAIGANSVADRANTVSVGAAGAERQITNVAAGTEDTDAVNVSQLKSSGLIDGSGNAVAAVTYDQNADGSPNYNSVTMGGGKSDGPVTIKNVAAGTDDTDAVNVGQLKSAGLVDNSGNTLDAVVYDPGSNRGQVTLGGVGAAAPVVLTNVANGVNQYDAVNFGQLSGLQSDLQNQINTVNGQVTNIDNRVTTLESNGGGNGGGTPEYVAANPSTQPTAGANVGDTTGVALGYNTAATGDGASAVGDSAQATGDSSTAVGSNAVASNTGGTALGSSATVNANNGVAVGNNATVASSASNGTAVGSGSSVNAASGTAVGQGASVASTATNSVALGAGSVATQANTVSVGSVGNERTITNVAAGVNATDAVNVGQLQSSQNWAQNYTDQKVGQLNSRINAVGQHADAGTAAAIAMTNIPQAYQPNQSSLGAGIGTFNGQTAVAVGMSTITPGGRWVLKGSLTGNSQGDVGVGFGASMVW
jgi:autotransporter adhesin